MHRRNPGFTLIELLIAVAIIAMVVAVAIPALTSAVQRSRQRRTMADMRSLALAIGAYETDRSFVPVANDVPAQTLEPVLCPTYLRKVPGVDGWANPIIYLADGHEYTLVSAGADGLRQGGAPLGPTTSFAADIVLAGGTFVQWPEGVQTR